MSRKLYKYQSFLSFTKFYPNSYIKNVAHFSNWKELNDPLEGYFRTSLYNNINELINEKNSVKILSLSKGYDNFPLWAHYASSRKGVCLEYTIDDDNLPNDILLSDIKYGQDFPSIDSDNDFRHNAIHVLSCKLFPWSYEKEVRLFSFGDEPFVSNPAIQLTGIIIGALAGNENQKRFRKICSEFTYHFSGVTPCFYQGRLLDQAPFYQIEPIG